MGVQTCKTHLRIPKRPPPAPPAPPVPPKDWQVPPTYSTSDYQTATSEYNYGRGAPSECCYSEGPHSVRSVPYTTKRSQPNSVLCYASCSPARSEISCCPRVCPTSSFRTCCGSVCETSLRCSPLGVHSSASVAAMYRPHPEQQVPLCSRSSCSQSRIDIAGYQASPTPCQTMHFMSMSRPMGPATSKSVAASVQPIVPVEHAPLPPLPVAEVIPPVSSLPPVPLERKSIARQKSSVSPVPMPKNKNRSLDKYKCEPLTYKRHIEQHIERLFKYLTDRQERLDECEKAIEEAKLNSAQFPNYAKYREMLAHKETRHLRSLRTRLRFEDFDVLGTLGHGYIGFVRLVEEKKTKNLYAMKALLKSQVYGQNHMAHVMAERDILAEADNEWIVKLYHSFQDDKYLYFILEFIPGGDMMSLLMKQLVFPEYWAQFYIAEISLAVQYVHDMGFIHRDMKPDNILIDANGHIKLTDFGLCTGFRWTHDSRYYRDETVNNSYQHDGLSVNPILDVNYPTITTKLTQREVEYSKKSRSLSLVGSPNYIAPEVLRRDGTIERLCDWWSVGVILYEMVIGYCPFMNLDLIKNPNDEYNAQQDPPEEIQKRILNWQHYLEFPARDHLLCDKDGYKHEISNATKDLIRGWICEPQDRLCQNGIEDIKDHSFFKNDNDWDWESIRAKPAPYIPQLGNSRDTRHFDVSAQSQPQMGNGTFGMNPKMPFMNGFTYHAFWQNLNLKF